ncbi:prepilin-type N-terminal cleavage/methylation domain-containing protein [bacterium]|nr:prepilin-type N-terminal cleavage/methylation domain-containing protein [bacterium]
MNQRTSRRAGFTLIEVLLAISLLALLSVLLGGVLSNCRKTASAAESTVARLRREIMIREILQMGLDVSQSKFSFETSGPRLSGFSFSSYGDLAGHRLKLRMRYVFEPDPLRPAYRMVRYVIAEGIGVTESKEILFEGVLDPVIEAHSAAAGEFVPAENVPAVPILLRLKFRLLRDPSILTAATRPDHPETDDLMVILKNGFA